MHDDPTEHTCPHGSRPIDERCDACWREENEDPIDFAMLTPPTRPGPCKAATAPEVDLVEKRLEREREAAPFIAAHVAVGDEVRIARGRVGDGHRFRVAEIGKGGFGETIVYGHNYGPVRAADVERVEVRHGSGKVKV